MSIVVALIKPLDSYATVVLLSCPVVADLARPSMTDLNCVTREIHKFDKATERGPFVAANLAISAFTLSQNGRGTAWDKAGQAGLKMVKIGPKFIQYIELAMGHQKSCPTGRGDIIVETGKAYL